MENSLLSAPKGSALAKLYEVQLQDNPQHRKATFAEVKEAILSGGFMGYGGRMPLSTIPGGVAYDIEERNFNQMTLALRKNSEFTEAFEYHVLKMWQSGLLHQSALRWLPQPPKELPGCQLEAKQLSFDNLLFVFVMLLGGVILASGLFVFSQLFQRTLAKST